MFDSDDLKKHLYESSSVSTQSAVIAEWNMNIPTNILKIGNYRYRPTETNSLYKNIPNSFDINDNGYYYTNATDADIIIDGTFDDEGQPFLFLKKNKKNNLLFSLEDCFKPFRPRSGINKARYIDKTYLHHPNINMAKRPRYYMPDKNDLFKYWTSIRTESLYKHQYGTEVIYSAKPTYVDNEGTQKDGEMVSTTEYGVSQSINGDNFISDTAPFVVYENNVPVNRIVTKIQTHIGSIDLGTFSNNSTAFSDPFYGNTNKQTPKKWKIQVLKNNNWTDIISFTSTSKRKDGSDIIKSDGYVEIAYGLKVPEKYRDIFIYAETLSSSTLLPEKNVNGYAYLVIENENEQGKYYIWIDDINDYEEFIPEYGWYLEEETVDRLTNFVTKFVDIPKFINSGLGQTVYREVDFISGIRIVVDTMHNKNYIFDLIELSPRLVANLTDRTVSFNVTKSASDLGVAGLPVSQLLASVGSLELFDYDDSFNINNKNSIINNYLNKNIQIKIYEIIVGVLQSSNGIKYDYYVPIKTLYTENLPDSKEENKHVSLSLKDLYFYFDSLTAPQLLMTNVSISTAVSTILDYIGFSNYVFKRNEGESEQLIPYFFVGPDQSVAQVLQDIAVSSQCAMFFDEYNNFVVMSKSYILPKSTERTTDLELLGSEDSVRDERIKNKRISDKLANIINVSSQSTNIFNGGKINYTSRYIQKSYGSIKQATMIDQDKTWIYKPVLLWEVGGTQNTKSINGEINNQSNYVLCAIPLNFDLTKDVPYVSNRQIKNNIISLGEGVYWITRYNGLFYANGEIIKFDAVEYNVAGVGDVWINSTEEYSEYFSKLPFNGKIYPTGRVRIYCEPNYEEINGVIKLKNGTVAKHGRGQFGTTPVDHFAGLNPYWADNTNVRGCSMKSEYIFDSSKTEIPTVVGPAGINNDQAKKSVRSGVIKNFLSTTNVKETDLQKLSTQSGTIQSSALVFQGPKFNTTETPRDFLSYVYKPLDSKYVHFGTRMRIVGRLETGQAQTPNGASYLYTIPGTTPDKNINISGGSGGIGVMVNPDTNVGYYFEICALGTQSLKDIKNVNNIIFYKIKKDSASSSAVPVKLWESLGQIVVDDGKFTGQYRMVNEKTPTVYDLSVEYKDIANVRRFYLYINGKLLKVVDDVNPLPKYNNMCLFVRGSATCMFENIYAVTNNYSQSTVTKLDTPMNSVFGDDEVDNNEAFRKYAMSGAIKSTYLAGISPNQIPEYDMYFDEFGTIMREASYFNIRYDKAYPALYAKLSPTFNRVKGYTVSGFRAGSYGAEFLIFNSTDTALTLDSGSGNYLRIQGITFTQQNPSVLSVDEYFNKNMDLSNQEISGDSLVRSPFKLKKNFEDIKLNRMTYGNKEFNISPVYIQSADSATTMMEWFVDRVMKPRQNIGLKIFANPMIQLGDIVSVDCVKNGIDVVGGITRFVVYNIEYSKTTGGPEMTVYLSQVEQ
jgi:hypothetical protein